MQTPPNQSTTNESSAQLISLFQAKPIVYFFPLPQILGILGMGYAIFNNAPTLEMRMKVYTNSALFLGVTAIFAFFWVRFKMKKGLFEVEKFLT